LYKGCSKLGSACITMMLYLKCYISFAYFWLENQINFLILNSPFALLMGYHFIVCCCYHESCMTTGPGYRPFERPQYFIVHCLLLLTWKLYDYRIWMACSQVL
jgi:hypothetical protein